MRFTLEVDFSFDGIDETSQNEIKSYLETLLNYGAESTSSEITLIKIEKD